MSSDYDAIAKEDIEGKLGRACALLTRLYSDPTHFVYEILQNAEDAHARSIQFALRRDRLEIRHNGRPFDPDNVRAICDIGKGTKAGDLTQVGKFGIGFKSVYAYTSTPEIHSINGTNGPEHFRIESYIKPKRVTDIHPGESWTTLIIIPFNAQGIEIPLAESEIAERLGNLGIRTLLFLQHLEGIEYNTPNGASGTYLRGGRKISDNQRKVTIIGQKKEAEGGNSIDEEENWLLFHREVRIPEKMKTPCCKDAVNAEIGFLREQDAKSKQWKITKVQNSRLVVFFPTEKETHLGFLIQGPYRTTPARDNIPKDDDWNRTLITATADLLTDSLDQLKCDGLLTVPVIETLPIVPNDFPEDSMFRPIFEKTQKALGDRDLLPKHGGGHVSALRAKLAPARSDALRDLLTSDQLSTLCNSEQSLSWMSGEITQNLTPALRLYLINELQVEEIDPGGFANLLSENFLSAQMDDWFQRFYEFLLKQEALWRAAKNSWDSPGPLRSKPILRLEDGSTVAPFDTSGNPNAYLPPKHPTTCPVVCRFITSHPPALVFLDRLGLSEPDEVADVIENILPKYRTQEFILNDEAYRANLDAIFRALKTDSQEKKKRLLDACRETPFVKATNAATREARFRRPEEVWLDTDDGLRAYLSGNPDVWTVDTDLARRFYSELLEIGLKTKITVTYEHNLGETVHVVHSYDHKSRYLGGFDERCEIQHLERALSTPCSTAKSRYMWEVLLKDRAHLVRGRVEECSTPSRYVRKEFIPQKEEMRYSKMGHYLAGNEWLQDRNGRFRKPSELSLADLPEEWGRSEALAKVLEMKLPEREQAMDMVTAGDPRLRKMIEYYHEAPEAEREKLLRLIPCELPPVPVPSFDEGLKNMSRVQQGRTESDDTDDVPVLDVIRYQEKLGEEVGERVTKDRTEPHTISFVPVRAQPSNEEAREFLYAEYHGRCQVTGTTFPKASSNVNGEAHNYFAACALLSYANAAYLNNEGNMLCVSADTMAKLKYASFQWLDDIAETIESFRKDSNTESVTVRIRLAGEDCTITWTQRHFMRLVALYDKA